LRSSSGRSGKHVKVGEVEISFMASLGTCSKRSRKRDDIFAVDVVLSYSAPVKFRRSEEGSGRGDNDVRGKWWMIGIELVLSSL
jgi:hypothetical protein